MRVGFALEYSLGHVTHAENLKRALLARRVGGGRMDGGAAAAIAPTYVDLPYDGTPVGRWGGLPGVRSNWSVRASLGAYLGLRPMVEQGKADALMFHTQVTSLFSAGLMRRVPSVVSLDATPVQIDALGAHYGHSAGGRSTESLKRAMNRRAFRSARALVTWSEWAKASLVTDYGIRPEKVTVIPPGVDVERWASAARRASGEREPGIVELLFVGGDFVRKGGPDLMEAWRRLPERTRARARLHVVTRESSAALRAYHEDFPPGVVFHHDVKPNSDELLRLFARAEAFVFPTRGDCLPLAVLEALAAGLPVISTPVGALAEAVQDGVNGLIVPAGDTWKLALAMDRLIDDPGLRRQMGAAATETARQRYDAGINAQRLMDVLRGIGGAAGESAALRRGAMAVPGVWQAPQASAERTAVRP